MIHSSGYMAHNQIIQRFLALNFTYFPDDMVLSWMSRTMKLSIHVVKCLGLYIDSAVQFKSKTVRHSTLSAVAWRHTRWVIAQQYSSANLVSLSAI